MAGLQSIFISHAAEDHKLAHAWQQLIATISNGANVPFYSGDRSSQGGIGLEEWRARIDQALTEAEHILVLLTPGSNERPWVLFESGIAHGQQKHVVPVVHFMPPSAIHDVFKAFQVHNGRMREDVYRLIELMLYEQPVPEASKKLWDAAYEVFSQSISQERLATFTRNLFQDHFHNQRLAKSIEGVWAARWTELDADGGETLFEEDALYVWAIESRIRMVGISAKKGLDEIKPGEATYYPMEGVVSPAGWIALSYWSAGAIPICGTCLLTRKGASGRRYEGRWQGYTARHIDEDPRLTHGGVSFVKIADEFLPPPEVKALREKMVAEGRE